MEFENILFQVQVKLEMNNTEFANYLGMHRTWLVALKNKNNIRRPLRNTTMYKIHNKTGIPLEMMDEYNESIKRSDK